MSVDFISTLSQLREKLGQDVKENEVLAPHVWYRIGGPATYFFTPKTNDEFIAALTISDQLGLQRFILGSGTNLLISDQGFNGFVIKAENRNFKIEDTRVYCEAGAVVVEVMKETLAAGLTGWNYLAGLPGTIGGAIRGNAGAYGKAIGDVINWVDVYQDGKVTRLSRQEMRFSYRHSRAKEESMVIIACELQLERGDIEEEKKMVDKYIKYRIDTQPNDYPNVGCVFKNTDLSKVTVDMERLKRELDVTDEELAAVTKHGKLPTSFVVDHLGLKGKQIGGAQVSTKHAAFIVNVDHAKAEHVIMLASDVKMRVRDQLGIQLEDEVEFVGF